MFVFSKNDLIIINFLILKFVFTNNDLIIINFLILKFVFSNNDLIIINLPMQCSQVIAFYNVRTNFYSFVT